MLDGMADTTGAVLYDATRGHPYLRIVVSSVAPILMIPLAVVVHRELRKRRGQSRLLSVISTVGPFVIGIFALLFVTLGILDQIRFQRAIAEGRFRVTEGVIESVRSDRSGRRVNAFVVNGRKFFVGSNTSGVGYDGGASEEQLRVGRDVRVHDIKGRIARLEKLPVASRP